MVKLPLPGSESLLKAVRTALGPDRKPLLIGIDGPDGVGKSSLASWLAWQLGMPAVHLDLYIMRNSEPLAWRTDELARLIGARIDNCRPVIVEGILILDALDCISRRPDFLVYVCGEGGHGLAGRIENYKARQRPEEVAQAQLDAFAESRN